MQTGLKSFGFGLESLGLLVARFPRLFAMLLVGLFGLALSGIPSLGFDGNILSVLSGTSRPFLSYQAVRSDFRDFSGDLGVIVRADDLYESSGFEKMREFHLELTVLDGIEGVFSLFSATRIDPATGAVESVIPEVTVPGDDVRALVAEAGAVNPLAAQLARVDRNAALISIETGLTEDKGNPPTPEVVSALTDEIRAIAPAGLTVDFVGYPVMRADAVRAIIDDQFIMVAIGIVMVLLISLATFRAIVPALICAAPAIMAIVSLLGAYGLAGAKMNYLSTALPTIAMVLALADTIMLYHVWAARRRDGLSSRQAVTAALRRVGPANSMTSITTALAFGSFAFSGNPALRTLALLGSSAVMLAFVTVMIVAPVLLIFFGDRIRGAERKSIFDRAGPWIARFAMLRPGLLAGMALCVSVLLGVGHYEVTEEHQMTRQLPTDSESARGERLALDLFGGVAPIYLVVPVPEGMSWSDGAALDRLAEAEAVFGEALGEDQVFSLARIRKAGMTPEKMKETLADAPDNLRGRFLSGDLTRYLVSGSAPFGMKGPDAVALADGVVKRLDEKGIRGTEVTGYPILLAIEIPAIVQALRLSLVMAIVLGVGVIALASRAPLVSIAAFLPNLIPVLAIETALWLIGEPMDVSHVIALTIAFGISIDNAVHVINSFLANKEDGMGDVPAIRSALEEVSPALVTATVMFIAGSVGTLFSTMPSVVNLGFLIMATLVAALISNLAFLPALILTLRRIMGRAS
ncbi:MAG: MMPL family transporter [Rhizobiaceae bacterium]|nr:MMPL family transporter [Rhizobiaceae bacterium]